MDQIQDDAPIDEEPLYVNAKQYYRILKRRVARARLEEVQALHSRIISALAHAPDPLRLKQTHGHSIPNEYGGAGFRQATFAEVKDFFDNPNASRANALNPFLVMQANLYVTQVSLAPHSIIDFSELILVCSNSCGLSLSNTEMSW